MPPHWLRLIARLVVRMVRNTPVGRRPHNKPSAFQSRNKLIVSNCTAHLGVCHSICQLLTPATRRPALRKPTSRTTYDTTQLRRQGAPSLSQTGLSICRRQSRNQPTLPADVQAEC